MKCNTTVSLLFALVMQQPALAQRSARFFDDFEDAEIGPPLVAGAYLLEAQGTFTDHADLGIEEVSGKLAIRGEGSIDTVLVNGRAAGWLGRSAYLSIESPLQGVVAIEASVTILEASLGGAGSTRGVMGGVLLESGSQDRLMLYFVNRGGVIGLRLSYSEGGVFNDSRGSQYLWQRGLTYKLRLELNVETGRARGFVNGSLLLEFDFFGSRIVSRAGVMACARSVGDLMEAHFDDLGLAYVVALPEGAQRIVVSRLEGGRVIADVTVRSAVDGALASAHEQFDPAWSVVEVSEGGRVEDGLIWENLSSDTFSYRLQREDIYFEQQAEVSGWIEIGALSYATRGDENFGLGVKPYVNEALVTPPLLTPAGLDACYMRLQDVSPSWIGECVGVRDETIVPYEGLSYRPAFSSEWSKAIALDTSIPTPARRRFWSVPEDPSRSLMVLGKVTSDAGVFNFQGAGAFRVQLEHTMCVAFFYAEFHGTNWTRAILAHASDDSSGIRVNGRIVGAHSACDGLTCYGGRSPIDFRPGKNLIAAYVFQSQGHFRLCIRFEDYDGRTIPVRISTDPAGYVSAEDGPAPEPGSEEHDCNGNCRADSLDLADGTSTDSNSDGLPDECQGLLVDCNRNGLADSDDISMDRSADLNRNNIPDECENALFVDRLVPYCLAIRLSAQHGVTSGELALAYDSTIVSAGCFLPGRDLEALRPQLSCDLEPALACPLPDGLDSALTLRWAHPGGEVLPPGTHEVLRLCFVPTPGSETDRDCSPVAFTSCATQGGARIFSATHDEASRIRYMAEFNGEVCGVPVLFRRGDANSDGAADITDAIAILRCQFSGEPCAGCQDASDANDDGMLSITDATYLLNWLFAGGAGLQAPHPECGPDGSPDALVGCDGSGC